MSRELEADLSILYNVHVIASRTDAALAEALKDMSPQDFALYSLIRVQGPLSPRDISLRHGTPASSVSAALHRIETAGHLQRRSHPSDNRTFLVELTKEGTVAHTAAREQFMAVLDPLTAALGPDLPTVRFALRRLASALAAMDGLDDNGAIDMSPAIGPTGPIDYHGPALTDDEQRPVRDHIDYLLWRRER